MTDQEMSDESELPHPLLTDRAVLPTAAVNEAVTAIRLWLHFLYPGGILYGLSRVGKSRIARSLTTDTTTLLGAPIPAVGISMANPDDALRQTLTAGRLYTELLDSLGHAASHSSRTVAKRGRLIETMIDRARQNNEYRFLMIIDEAQFVTKAQYGHLIDLQNQLDMRKIKLTTVLVGMPDLIDRKATYVRNGEAHITGRFMHAEHEIKGVCDLSELSLICRAMDSMSEHPPGSGISFTHGFARRAFENGWRLESYADMIWSAFHDVCRTSGAKAFVDLPMAPVIALLRVILIMIQDEDNAEPQHEPAVIRRLIKQVSWTYVYAHIVQAEKFGKGAKGG